MSSAAQFMAEPAIDVHGHCGEYGGYNDLTARLMNASAEVVARRAAQCGISLTVVSELSAFDPSSECKADVAAGNARAAAAVEPLDTLRFYAVLNPLNEGWEEDTSQLLEHPKCVGVKLHPRWHYWPVREYGDRVFAFLNEHKALTLTHTGNEGNDPLEFVPFANKCPDMHLILAHIGHDEELRRRYDRQTEAVKRCTQGNVWADTSSSNSVISRLIEFAVDQIGAERILFGTDTPLYFPATQKARVAYAEISDDAKRLILHDNAAELLGISLRDGENN